MVDRLAHVPHQWRSSVYDARLRARVRRAECSVSFRFAFLAFNDPKLTPFL
jgi:hypothetical protein